MPIVLMPVEERHLNRFFMGAKISNEISSSGAQGDSGGAQSDAGPAPQFGCS